MAGMGDSKGFGDGESFAALFEREGTTTQQKKRVRPGDRLEAVIVAVGRDAVFADLGTKEEGVFEIPDLVGPNGQLTVAVGSRVSALVRSVDDRTGQVKLEPVFVRSATTAEAGSGAGSGEDDVVIPVTRSAPLLLEGARVRGKVTGVERYGVFVQIVGTQGRGGRGLVPTAETGTPRGADLRKAFPLGHEVEAKIVSIADDGKIRLSITALAADDEKREFQAFTQGQAGEGGAAPPAGGGPAKKAGEKRPAPSPRGFGTLGDLLTKKR